MEDVVHAAHRVAHGLGVAHVADEEPHLGGELGAPLLQPVAHVVLLLLVAGEDADLPEVRVDEVLEHGVAEAARAARDHEVLPANGDMFYFLSDASRRSDSISSM